MNIPGYDAWRTEGLPEFDNPVMEICPECDGEGWIGIDENRQLCVDCDGEGSVEAEIEEPDGDYLYEKMRDARFVE